VTSHLQPYPIPLCALALSLGRLKTGTCPRLDGKSINFSLLKEQRGDDPPKPFSIFFKARFIFWSFSSRAYSWGSRFMYSSTWSAAVSRAAPPVSPSHLGKTVSQSPFGFSSFLANFFKPFFRLGLLPQ
jgi:hypothetical protein